MRRLILQLLVATVVFPAFGYAQPVCVAPVLSDQQVKDIVEKARATRTDLPARFAESRSTVRRQGCHYLVIEDALPETPDKRNIFTVNQHGAIVDAQPGNPTCPDRVFTEDELAGIVKKERDKRRDLPPAFASSRPRVARMRCMYLYYEYAVPEKRGDYQVFTIDPLGELMTFSRSKPY